MTKAEELMMAIRGASAEDLVEALESLEGKDRGKLAAALDVFGFGFKDRAHKALRKKALKAQLMYARVYMHAERMGWADDIAEPDMSAVEVKKLVDRARRGEVTD